MFPIIPFDEDMILDSILKNSTAEDYLFFRDLNNRKLYLDGEINMTSSDIVKLILAFNREDFGLPAENRPPILLFVASNGGDVDYGFELIDVILNSITPVYTINLCRQYSMGFLIGLVGHKRYATKHATFLLHDGSNYIYDSGSKVQDVMRFNAEVSEKIKDLVLTHTKITEKEYDDNIRVEWYMYADEAKEKGVTDYIIGEDCSLEEVV